MDEVQATLMYYYVGWFLFLLGVFWVFRQITGAKTADSKAAVVTQEFKRFQLNYVIVYLIVMGADWLQGPYVYALYTHYGFSIEDIGVLFVAGFASSAVFGTVAGTMADKYGRKKLCLAFSLFYGMSCITKHFSDYWTLMCGRILGGVSTSILFSAFEAWMVHQHHDGGFHEDWLGMTYSLCTSGNAIVAIVAGVFAGQVRDRFGPVAPFDASLVLLTISGILVATSWSDNYGDSTIDLKNTLTNAWVRIKEDRKIALLGMIQSFFEGSMYIFVFMWTPALESTSQHGIFHGWIFSSFMICVLIGSNLFKYFLDKKLRVEKTSVYLFAVSAVVLFLPTFIQNHTLRLTAFFVFEVCVGLFWPSMGFLRSRYVPEEVRATVMNLFRIPLNIIVVLVLANIGKLSERGVFISCFLCLLPALFCQMHLVTLTVDSPEQVKREPDDRKGLTASSGREVEVDVDVEDESEGGTSSVGFPSVKTEREGGNKGAGSYTQVSTSDQSQ